MAGEQILIFTNFDDVHSDVVVQKLVALGHPPIRLNTNDIPLGTSMALQFDAGRWQGGIAIHNGGRAIDIMNVRSVWWRRPAHFGLPTDLPSYERRFAQQEIEHALGSLWNLLDCYWMSHPNTIRQASWKGEQLQRAAQMGFEVPRTLITNDPAAVRAFFDACQGQMIFKILTTMVGLGVQEKAEEPDESPPPAKVMQTVLITERELAMLDTVRGIPCLFQEYIPKQYELRVTVIGDDVFAAAIYSQFHPKTRIDFRNYDVDIPYRKAKLPVELAERCLQFVRSYGLNYGALDLIFTPDGRYVFLENNPIGQYLFVERLVPELRMTEALAACLIRGANS